MKINSFIVVSFCLLSLFSLSCSKDDGGSGGRHHDHSENGFYIDVDYLPASETNDELAPRLMINFNDEAVMIELRRPASDLPMESLLFLFPGKESLMICGNDSLMICVPYNLETFTPSTEVLVVTRMNTGSLLLTKCIMDWNTYVMTKGDQMVIPIEGAKNRPTCKGSRDDDMRYYFYNNFLKPFAESLDKMEGTYAAFGINQTIVIEFIKMAVSTAAPAILFSDDQEGFVETMELPITMWVSDVVQTGVLKFFPDDASDMASKVLVAMDWFYGGGEGRVSDNDGSGVASPFYMSTYYNHSSYATYAASNISNLDPVFILNLSVHDVTESSARLQGHFSNGANSSMSPVEMGYIYKVNGGTEFTVEDMGYNGRTITGLHGSTKYVAYAYAKSISGQTILSPAVSFVTLGFEAFPNSLSFPAAGDTKYVGLRYPDNDISGWSITNKPSWCTVKKVNDKMFSVKVGSSSMSRSGTITVVGQSHTLGSISQEISVIQQSTTGWDGTSWVFSGTLSYNTIYGNTTEEVPNSTLVVNNVANNDITFDLSLSYYFEVVNESFYLDGSGNLVYTGNGNILNLDQYYSVDMSVRVVFTRTGTNTATADFLVTGTLNGSTIMTGTGLMNGTLANTNP